MPSTPESGPARPTTGVVGLGMIGSGAARNLVAAGHAVLAHDVRPEAADGVEGLHAVLDDPRSVAEGAGVVLVSVVTAQQARDVLDGERGLLAAGRRDLVVCLLVTIAVEEVRALAQLCSRAGATLLDVGVTQAGDGKLVSMVGGPDEVLRRARPALDACSKAVVHCGPTGAGMTAKIARNIVSYSCWAAVREAMSVAAAGGVDPDTFLGVLEAAQWPGTSPLAMAVTNRDRPEVARGRAPATTALADKDLAAAQALAVELGIATPVVDAVRPAMGATFAGDLSPVPRS